MNYSVSEKGSTVNLRRPSTLQLILRQSKGSSPGPVVTLPLPDR